METNVRYAWLVSRRSPVVVADLDRMQELEAVDSRRQRERIGVAMAGNRSGDVNQVHHRAAKNVAEGIRVVRKDHLRGLGCRLAP
jgi:hypothetical protein